jgi:hypothetical protein
MKNKENISNFVFEFFKKQHSVKLLNKKIREIKTFDSLSRFALILYCTKKKIKVEFQDIEKSKNISELIEIIKKKN